MKANNRTRSLKNFDFKLILWDIQESLGAYHDDDDDTFI